MMVTMHARRHMLLARETFGSSDVSQRPSFCACVRQFSPTFVRTEGCSGRSGWRACSRSLVAANGDPGSGTRQIRCTPAEYAVPTTTASFAMCTDQNPYELVRLRRYEQDRNGNRREHSMHQCMLRHVRAHSGDRSLTWRLPRWRRVQVPGRPLVHAAHACMIGTTARDRYQL